MATPKLKPIRFFATNRDRSNLGRTFDQADRIQLQKGGYHWIDMKRFMAHYLATTDQITMPPEAIILDSEEKIFEDFLAKPAIKRIIIGIHGYNVPFHGALTSFSLLADTLSQVLEEKHNKILITYPITAEKYENGEIKVEYDKRLNDEASDLTAFIGFSWPSNGNVLDYISDRVEAMQTAPILGNLISYIRKQNPNAKVHIIAHSMGNYLTCNMLGGSVIETFTPLSATGNATIENQLKRQNTDEGKGKWFVDRYLMLAPDVERREVTQCDVDGIAGGKTDYTGPFYEGIENLVEETHLFYSRHDNALKASVVEKEVVNELGQKVAEFFTQPDLNKRWESSLGLNPLPALAPDNMYGHNATVLTNREIDHGDYFDSLAIAEKLVEIIMQAG
jgi:esterase/lipase superfamily enzyme